MTRLRFSFCNEFNEFNLPVILTFAYLLYRDFMFARNNFSIIFLPFYLILIFIPFILTFTYISV